MEEKSKNIEGMMLRYEKGSMEDGDGMRTVIYMKGCPLHCWWCSTPESHKNTPEVAYTAARCVSCGKCIVNCPSSALDMNAEGKIVRDFKKCTNCFHCVDVCPYSAHKIYGEKKTVQDVLDIIEQDEVNYFFTGGGVTFSGGECLTQADFVSDVLEECHHRGINTCIETTVCMPWEEVEKVLPHLDTMYIDLKIMNHLLHQKYVGGNLEQIQNNIKKIDSSDYNIKIRLRVPTMSSINGNDDNMKALGEFYRDCKKVEYVELLPYHRLGTIKYDELEREYRLKDEVTPSEEEMERLARVIIDIADKPVLVSGVRYQ